MVSTADAAPPDLDALLARWDRFVWRECSRRGRRLALDPEELHADAVLEAVRRFPTYDPARAAFSTWLAFVIRNVVADASGRRRRRVRAARMTVFVESRGRFVEPADLLDLTADKSAADPADAAADREHRQATTDAVAEAIGKLTPPQREAIRSRFWENGGGLVTHANRQNLQAALATLREALAPLAVGAPHE